MRVEHLQYLVEIDNQRSITQAAKTLYTTQPALSVVVSGIERELGFHIFRRTKQGVVPTTKGEKVLAEARQVLRYYRGWRELDESQGEVSGDIHIITTPVAGKQYVASAIARTKRQYPKVQFYLSEVHWNEALQAIASHKAGIVFLSLPDESMDELAILCRKSGYTFHEVGDDEYRLIVSARNPLAQREFLTAEDIRQTPFIMYMPPNDRLNDKLRALLPPGGQRFTVNSNTLIWNLVSQDLAISTAPASDQYRNYYIEKDLVKMLPLRELQHRIHHLLVSAHDLTLAEQSFAAVTCGLSEEDRDESVSIMM